MAHRLSLEDAFDVVESIKCRSDGRSRVMSWGDPSMTFSIDCNDGKGRSWLYIQGQSAYTTKAEITDARVEIQGAKAWLAIALKGGTEIRMRADARVEKTVRGA